MPSLIRLDGRMAAAGIIRDHVLNPVLAAHFLAFAVFEGIVLLPDEA